MVVLLQVTSLHEPLHPALRFKMQMGHWGGHMLGVFEETRELRGVFRSLDTSKLKSYLKSFGRGT